jgi:selenide, water dikinase
VHACTDITGFGLIGHATEMASASGVTLEIHSDDLPLLEGVRDLAPANRSGGMGSNREHFGAGTSLDPGIDPLLVDIAFDPQTSGGLLAAVDSGAAGAIVSRLSAVGAGGAVIGHVRKGGAFRVTLQVR